MRLEKTCIKKHSTNADLHRFCYDLGVSTLCQDPKSEDTDGSRNHTFSYSQLTAADINYTTVQPLVRKYARLNNPSVVYACFVVRSHFLSLGSQKEVIITIVGNDA